MFEKPVNTRAVPEIFVPEIFSYPPKLEGVPTLSERITMMPDATDLGWENLGSSI
jgi:hypothetical protein